MPKKRKGRGASAPVFLFILLLVAGAVLWHRFGNQEITANVVDHVENAAAVAVDRAGDVVEKVTAKVGEKVAEIRQPESFTLGEYSQSFTYAGEPVATTYPNPIEVLKNIGYEVGYDETRKNPVWSAYRVPAATLDGKFPRPGKFITDERTQAKVTHNDYTRTGYDRGHMAPNLAIASRFGEQAQTETFFMSNIVPQTPALNQGPWRLLEETVATKTAPADGEVWVITGPIYDATPQYLPAGNEIPDAFFKVIVDETPEGPRMQAFIMPQTIDRKANFREYRVSVDEIERETGLDLFSKLPDDMENRLEAEVAPLWIE